MKFVVTVERQNSYPLYEKKLINIREDGYAVESWVKFIDGPGKLSIPHVGTIERELGRFENFIEAQLCAKESLCGGE